MTALKYSAFTLTACSRCDSPVFRGWFGGFDLRMDHLTVPLRDALVLDKYGQREVIVLEKTATGLHGKEFVPRAEIADYSRGTTRMYAINHVCGTRHDPNRRRTK